QHDKKSAPSYRHHKQSGQAIVTLTDGLGGRRDVLLGPWRSKESRIEYARVLAEWEAADRRLTTRAAADISVTELVDRFWPWVEEHYRRPDGSATTEPTEYKMSLRPVCYLYGSMLVRDFKPLALKAVRQLMINGYRHPKYGDQLPLARGVVNK